MDQSSTFSHINVIRECTPISVVSISFGWQVSFYLLLSWLSLLYLVRCFAELSFLFFPSSEIVFLIPLKSMLGIASKIGIFIRIQVFFFWFTIKRTVWHRLWKHTHSEHNMVSNSKHTPDTNTHKILYNLILLAKYFVSGAYTGCNRRLAFHSMPSSLPTIYRNISRNSCQIELQHSIGLPQSVTTVAQTGTELRN